MPTENRSSNTEMVNVPRDLLARVSSTELGMSARKDRYAAAYEARAILAQPAPQPHPDPIAWMVGNAIWWTKEEAERDAAATGLPIVGLGPMTESADIDQLQLEIAELQLALTMHDDAAIQDECIRAENSELRAQLAEAQALLRLVRDGNGYLEEHDWERINAITEYGGGEATQSQNVSYERLLREVARELREPSHVGWEDSLASRIDAALSASAEPSSPTWSCQSCQLEQPTDRPCDVCGGKTEPVATKP